MNTPLDCPDPTCWQALLGSLPPEQRQRYERHLETCPLCQERLDHVEPDQEMLRLGQQFGDPTVEAADETLERIRERLHDCPAPAAPLDLFFLSAGTRPGLLGILGAYEVLEVIGQGGMGVVLKAREPELQRLVAIKVLSPALVGSRRARQRFTREAQAAAAVRHEHMVPVYRVDEQAGLPYLVMPYVAGESLQQRLDRSGPLPLADVVRLGQQTARGLAAAHAQGLIHRDIKPANLLLEDVSGDVKITDFGLARLVDDVGLTQSGVVVGTPEYMAPEQARGESVDHRADLFSLGSVLYAMCTGQSPFHGSSTAAVLHQLDVVAAVPVRELNPDVPAWLEQLISRLLAREPEQRLQSAAEVAALLEGYIAHLRQPGVVPAPMLPGQVGSPSELSPPASVSPATRGLLFFGLITLLFVGGLGLALGLLAQVPPPVEKAPRVEGQQMEFYQDFRPNHPWGPQLLWTGREGDEVIEPDERGLRIKLSGQRTNIYPCGVVLRSPVKGNFEVTAGYEIVQAERPLAGQGVGFEVWLTLQSPDREALSMIRVKKVDGQEIYGANRAIDQDGRRRYFFQAIPIENAGPAGQLRITRQEKVAAFWVAEGVGGEFRKLHQCEGVGDEDLNQIRVAAYPGQVAAPVEVRLVDLKVRADSVEPHPEAVRPAAAGPGGKKWLTAALAVSGVIGVLALLCGGLALWRRRRARKETFAPVRVTCPDCDKVITVRAQLAGKRMKCPQCGQPVLIPADRAFKAGRPRS
jgi:serine/threonine-protein kinase